MPLVVTFNKVIFDEVNNPLFFWQSDCFEEVIIYHIFNHLYAFQPRNFWRSNFPQSNIPRSNFRQSDHSSLLKLQLKTNLNKPGLVDIIGFGSRTYFAFTIRVKLGGNSLVTSLFGSNVSGQKLTWILKIVRARHGHCKRAARRSEPQKSQNAEEQRRRHLKMTSKKLIYFIFRNISICTI